MYYKSNVGQHLRKYIGVHLAPWHNYKWASIMIIKIFGRDFIGPFFHRLFPNHAFDMNKMKFPAVCTLLSYMRLSYPSFRDQLMEAKNTDGLSVRATTLLNNMWSMFEYFIPVVQYIIFHCVLCNMYIDIICVYILI